MPWISKYDLQCKLIDAKRDGETKGYQDGFQACKEGFAREDYHHANRMEDIKEAWEKIRQDQKDFEDHKATEFFKMCKELNWNVGR